VRIPFALSMNFFSFLNQKSQIADFFYKKFRYNHQNFCLEFSMKILNFFGFTYFSQILLEPAFMIVSYLFFCLSKTCAPENKIPYKKNINFSFSSKMVWAAWGGKILLHIAKKEVSYLFVF
jgi:hypothetical protein